MVIVERVIRVRGERERLLNVIENVSATLAGGWRRDRKAEKDVRKLGSEVFCFEAPETKQHPHGHLGLHLKGAALVGANPAHSYWEDGRRRWNKPHDEADEHYRRNEILLAFYERFLVPLSPDLGVEATISDGVFRLEDHLTTKTIEHLVNWAKQWCPPNSCSAAERCWAEFLIGAHREGAELDPWLLRRWIAEEWRFPLEEAKRRADEYKTVRAVLARYDDETPVPGLRLVR